MRRPRQKFRLDRSRSFMWILFACIVSGGLNMSEGFGLGVTVQAFSSSSFSCTRIRSPHDRIATTRPLVQSFETKRSTARFAHIPCDPDRSKGSLFSAKSKSKRSILRVLASCLVCFCLLFGRIGSHKRPSELPLHVATTPTTTLVWNSRRMPTTSTLPTSPSANAVGAQVWLVARSTTPSASGSTPLDMPMYVDASWLQEFYDQKAEEAGDEATDNTIEEESMEYENLLESPLPEEQGGSSAPLAPSSEYVEELGENVREAEGSRKIQPKRRRAAIGTALSVLGGVGGKLLWNHVHTPPTAPSMLSAPQQVTVSPSISAPQATVATTSPTRLFPSFTKSQKLVLVGFVLSWLVLRIVAGSLRRSRDKDPTADLKDDDPSSSARDPALQNSYLASLSTSTRAVPHKRGFFPSWSKPEQQQAKATSDEANADRLAPSVSVPMDAPTIVRSASSSTSHYLSMHPKHVRARSYPKSRAEEKRLQEKYAAIPDVGDRAFQILLDLGMVEVTCGGHAAVQPISRQAKSVVKSQEGSFSHPIPSTTTASESLSSGELPSTANEAATDIPLEAQVMVNESPLHVPAPVVAMSTPPHDQPFVHPTLPVVQEPRWIPKSADDELIRLQEKYASIVSLEDRAFQILVDLGMVQTTEADKLVIS